jgi:hypothetical protein
VVVYRNGVAYFERYAALHGSELKLRVPSERLDDLLKSQKSTIDAASVEGQRLTGRAALEDRMAELTLESRREAAVANR